MTRGPSPYPKLGRNDVEPLGAILADPYHFPAPARAVRALGLDDDAGRTIPNEEVRSRIRPWSD